MRRSPAPSANASEGGSSAQVAQCKKCGVATNESLKLCPSCGSDLGCPNVRAADAPAEVAALEERYKTARENARSRGVADEFEALVAALRDSSHVTVAMPPFYARGFLNDTRVLYSNYEKLVGASARAPAPLEDDSHRCVVGGKLFGSYADQIKYGILSLDDKALSKYGNVFLRLRDVTVEDRVSFLHENSYLFVDNLKSAEDDSIPAGFRSSWRNRDQLAAAKLEPDLAEGSTIAEWSGLLVVQGPARADDRFIEAHIFGTFNAEAVAAGSIAGAGTSRDERIDIECIKEILAKRGLECDVV